MGNGMQLKHECIQLESEGNLESKHYERKDIWYELPC